MDLEEIMQKPGMDLEEITEKLNYRMDWEEITMRLNSGIDQIDITVKLNWNGLERNNGETELGWMERK